MRDISFATILFGNNRADNIGVMYGYMESASQPTGMSRTQRIYLSCQVSNKANGEDMQLIAGPSSAALDQPIRVCSKVHKQCPPSTQRETRAGGAGTYRVERSLASLSRCLR